MNLSVEVTAHNRILINGRDSGYGVSQDADATRVYSTNGSGKLITLPQQRYSLASESPACGHGRSEFEQDFLKAIVG